MSELETLEKLAIGLTRSQEQAKSFGDDLLVYLLSMAISRVGKKSNDLRKAAEKARVAPNLSQPRTAQVYDFPSGATYGKRCRQGPRETRNHGF